MDSTYQNRVIAHFIVGGGWQYYLSASQANVVVLVDSLDEVQGVPDSPRLIKLPLGGDDTALSLLERVCAAHPEMQPLLDEYRQGQNIHLSSGMAQDFRLGKCAILDLEDRGDLEHVFWEVFTRLLEAGNGQLDLVIVREFNSNAGGMGAGGGPAIGSRFCNYVAYRSAAKIRRAMVRLGGLTYARVAPRAIVNAGQTTQENLSFMLNGMAPARELRDLDLYELPLRSEDGAAIGDNRELRSRLGATLAQARYADSVNHLLNLSEVNRIARTRFGGMLRSRACWSGMLAARQLMRAAASNYRRQLKALRDDPAPADLAFIENVTVEQEAQGQALPSVEQVMQRMRQRHTLQDPMIDTFTEGQAQTYKSTVWVHMVAQSGALDGILTAPERPKSLSEFRTHSQRLRGLLSHLERAREDAHKTAQAQTRAFEKQRQAIKTTIRRARSFWRHLDVLLRTRSRYMKALQAQFEAYAHTHVHYSEAVAKREALAAAVTQVAQVLDAYQAQWLGRLEQGLEAVMGQGAIQLGTVVFTPLEAVYSDLMDATLRARIAMESGNEAHALAVLKPVLLGAVSHVTLAGLGEMFDCAPEPGAILSAIEDERYAYRSPLWGGTSTYANARYRFVVLPPLSAADRSAMVRAAEERQFKPILAVASSTAAGCCTVALDFYPVGKMGDVLPPLYTTTNGVVAHDDPVYVAATHA